MNKKLSACDCIPDSHYSTLELWFWAAFKLLHVRCLLGIDADVCVLALVGTNSVNNDYTLGVGVWVYSLPLSSWSALYSFRFTGCLGGDYVTD